MTTFLPRISQEGFEISGYTQENTNAVRSIRLGNLCLPSRPDCTDDIATVERYRKLLKTVQQIIFLPHFTTTDHIFYGETGALTSDQGYPTVRTGLIDGPNFRIHISTNYNFRHTSIGLDMKDVHLRTEIELDERVLNSATVDWLTEQIFIPVRDEVMLLPIEQDRF